MLPITDIKSRDQRFPGQVPDMEAIKLANTQPKEWSIDRMLKKPILTARDVVADLSLGISQVSNWVGIINHAMFSVANELEFRKEIVAQSISHGIDPIVRNIIGVRAMAYYRRMKKGYTFVIDLEKAEARGGNYFRRVPKGNGKGYNYYYDEDKYHNSKSAHMDGERATGGYLTNKIKVILSGLGKGGGDKAVFKGMIKKYGIEKVSSVLEDCKKKGNLKIEKRKFYWLEKGSGEDDKV